MTLRFTGPSSAVQHAWFPALFLSVACGYRVPKPRKESGVAQLFCSLAIIPRRARAVKMPPLEPGRSGFGLNPS